MSDNDRVATETMMPVNGIEVCTETFGERSDQALLLIAGATGSMDWWDDEFCRRLAAGRRFVIRYDHRDTGRSTGFPAGLPPYTRMDLAHDALGVLDALGVHRAHLVGLSMGGVIARRIAVERPHRVRSITLIATGPADEPLRTGGDTPESDEPDPGWTDRRTAVGRIMAAVRTRGGPFTSGEAQLRRLAERVFDRTPDMAAAQVNHLRCAAGPPVRGCLADINVPALVLHGTQDPFLPADRARELAGAIPGARLVWLDGVGHEVPPPAVWAQVIDEILATGGR